ncbi:hypothetical protein ABN214_15950 [Proteus terrae]|uniref:hypothetical protein n=1 Tax=Proteus terrae TaxID=1574161 RepID=UPI0032DB75C0
MKLFQANNLFNTVPGDWGSVLLIAGDTHAECRALIKQMGDKEDQYDIDCIGSVMTSYVSTPRILSKSRTIVICKFTETVTHDKEVLHISDLKGSDKHRIFQTLSRKNASILMHIPSDNKQPWSIIDNLTYSEDGEICIIGLSINQSVNLTYRDASLKELGISTDYYKDKTTAFTVGVNKEVPVELTWEARIKARHGFDGTAVLTMRDIRKLHPHIKYSIRHNDDGSLTPYTSESDSKLINEYLDGLDYPKVVEL